jgi:transcriptional regulator with XRE-family HTH domain
MNLVNLRKRRNLNQTQLAERIGVDQTTISRAERMAPSTTLDIYLRIADELGVSLAEIFGDERSSEEAALLRTYRSLHEGKQKEGWERLLRMVIADAGAEVVEDDKTVGLTKP